MNWPAVLRIIRPINCGMIGFAVIVGEFVSKPPVFPVLQTLLGFSTGFFVCAYSMVVNDVYDVEVDGVNQPDRPIPSGQLSVDGAWRLSIVLLVAGMACSLLSLSVAAVVIALLYAFLSWLYSARAKKAGLAGNLIVASSLAIPFIYGGVVSGGLVFSSLLLMMAFTSFFSGVGREVVKAMADIEGDAKRGVASVARSSGLKVAGFVGSAFFLLAVVTSWIPLILGIANQVYSVGVLVPDAIFVYLAVSTTRDHGQENAHRVKQRALLGMLVGLFVFVGGAF
ncbi:MAG: geranylgeranylglycerol-phosphate geranylgeranyltransferase [Nitrososphaerales archaeon]|nr:geranylgeranylglycerol-phosphate geranylgeranyltransferase [Nitrososphaerales archaeon]